MSIIAKSSPCLLREGRASQTCRQVDSPLTVVCTHEPGNLNRLRRFSLHCEALYDYN